MTDYSNWKILIAEADEKADEYAAVAQWCNEGQKYHIEDTGEYFEVVKNPEPTPPTDEEIRQMRERAYVLEVDPITCHINRLKDEEQTQEIIFEIEQLKQERSLKVIEIKERYPYSEDEESGE